MPRGLGVRCSGYLSSDGRFAYCTREEHAGVAPLEQTDPPSWRHILEGECRCGATHAPARDETIAQYDYQDADGTLRYQVVRLPGKQFRQRRPDGNGGWIWDMHGVTRVLYRLPAVMNAAYGDDTVYVAEGEKDVHALEAAGAVATCNPGGAGKWRPEYGELLSNASAVVIVADYDAPGLAHARQVAQSLPADRARIVLPAEGKDAADHLAAGYGLADFLPYIEPADEPGITEAAASQRVFIDASDFAASQVAPPPAILGDEETLVIPAGGFCLLAGRPGVGKTTFLLDLICHLAAGVDYPPADPGGTHTPTPWNVPRPIRVALIENEGPMQMFQAKLAEKLAVFPHPIGRAEADSGCLVIQHWRWGAFSFADQEAATLAQAELDEARIDLVVGDPLGSLGSTGVGSPQDTRDFVALLRPLGLGINRAFLFLHHFRERAERTEDELARISGAWGGHLDTLITLAAEHHADEVRLAYPKLRWAKKRAPKPIILGRVWAKASFEAIAEEDDLSVLEPILYECLTATRTAGEGRGGQGWMIATEIAKKTERRRTHVTKALEGAPHLFARADKETTKAVGAKSNAVLWGLAEWADETEEDDDDEPESLEIPF